MRANFQTDEFTARQLVLVQVVDANDTGGHLIGAAEREAVEQAALAAAQAGDAADAARWNEAAYLTQRASGLLDIVARRQPALGALRQPPAWQGPLLWLLPLAALVLGAAIDRLDSPRQVNMLSPPLVLFVLWNLAIYALLLTRAARAGLRHLMPWKGAAQAQDLPLLRTRMPRWLRGTRGGGQLRAAITARFQLDWHRTAAGLEGARVARMLHAAAAAWALGVALSIVTVGLVREYRIGWESTFLDAPQVHAFLSVLFAPVVAVLPLDAFSLADVQRMHFASGAEVGRVEARHWIGLYLGLLLLLVALPRAALACWAAWRARRHAAAVHIDLDAPYYRELLAQARPAHVLVGLVPADAQTARQVLAILGQATEPARSAAPADLPDPPLIRTARGDTLRLLRVPPASSWPVDTYSWSQAEAARRARDEAAARRSGTLPLQQSVAEGSDAAATAVAAPGVAHPARRNLLGLLAGRRDYTVGDVPQELREVRRDADVVLVTAAFTAQISACATELRWLQRPLIVLWSGDEQPDVAAMEVDVVVLPLREVARNWSCDERLQMEIGQFLASDKAAGWRRIVALWQERHRRRFDTAMRMLAGELVAAAREAAAPSQVSELAERLGARQTDTLGAWLQLHGIDSTTQAFTESWPEATQDAFAPASGSRGARLKQAGAAGAAGGAALGATVDLMVGGITLGAAAALGALLGGGAALAGGVLKGREAQPLSDEALLALTCAGLLRYARVAQHGRSEAGRANVGWAGATEPEPEPQDAEPAAREDGAPGGAARGGDAAPLDAPPAPATWDALLAQATASAEARAAFSALWRDARDRPDVSDIEQRIVDRMAPLALQLLRLDDAGGRADPSR